MCPLPTFQLLSSVFVPFISFQRLFSTEVIPGYVTLIQVQINFKKPPHLHVLPSSEGFSRSSTVCLTAESDQIEAGTRRWFPDKCPCHFPLQTWKVLASPSGLCIIRKQGCGNSQPSSQEAQESTSTHSFVTMHIFCLLHSY